MSKAMDDLRLKLAATLKYGEEIANKLKDPNLGPAMRTDLEAEFEAVEERAQNESAAVAAQEKVEARENRINSIGVQAGVIKPTEEAAGPQYANPIEALVHSEAFGEFVARVKAGDPQAALDAAEFEYGATAADVFSDPAGDKVTQVLPGITNLNYPNRPLRVGDLFFQGTMGGSNLSFLKIPAGATADADYQDNLGDQKGGTPTFTLDVGQVFARTIAARALIPSQNLEDIEGLESELRQLLLIGPGGLGEKRENAYINGTGGAQIEGILPLSPDDSTISGDYVSKSVFKAAADIFDATGFEVDAVVASGSDWFDLVTEVGTEDNRPLFGPWGAGWGQDGVTPPIVKSRFLNNGQIIVGSFKAATRLARKAVTIFADASGLGLRDNNLVLFVAEVREAVLHRYGKDPFRTVTPGS